MHAEAALAAEVNVLPFVASISLLVRSKRLAVQYPELFEPREVPRDQPRSNVTPICSFMVCGGRFVAAAGHPKSACCRAAGRRPPASAWHVARDHDAH
jgi:hypothetical protein